MPYLSPQNIQLCEEAFDALLHNHFHTALGLINQCNQRDDAWYLIYANCMIGLKRFDQCLEALGFIQVQNTKPVNKTLAHFYAETGQPTQAIQTLYQIPNWMRDLGLVLSIAQLYTKEAKRYPKNSQERQQSLNAALESYQSHPNYLNKRKILIPLASLYCLRQEYAEALNIYASIGLGENQSENEDIQHKINALKGTFFRHANYFMAHGNYQAALQSFESVPNHLKPIDTLKAQGSCYIQLEQYIEASNLYYDLYYNRLLVPEFYHTMMWCVEKSQMTMLQAQTVHQYSFLAQPSTGTPYDNTPPAPPNSSMDHAQELAYR